MKSAGLFAALWLLTAAETQGAGQDLPVPQALYLAYPEAPRRDAEMTWIGSRYILHRRYEEGIKALKAFQQEAPQSLVPSLGLMFLHHTHMLENFDFRFRREFLEAKRENARILKRFTRRSTENRWDHLMIGASLGMHGLMYARDQKWLQAASVGWEAVTHMKKAGETRDGMSPLYDVYYGLGMYHYWMSWAQQKSLILTMFPDRREQGLREIRLCAEKALISGPMASFALAYMDGIAGDYEKALAALEPLSREFPENLLVRSLKGRILVVSHPGEEGIELLESILKQEPSYTFTGFHLAQALYRRQRDPERVRLHLEAFVRERGMKRPPQYLSPAYFYLAEIYASKRDWSQAKANFNKVEGEYLSLLEKRRYQQLKQVMK